MASQSPASNLSAQTVALTPSAGLTSAEVQQRIATGQSNTQLRQGSRSIRNILISNIFTRINLIYAILLAIVLSTGFWLDGLFGVLIVVNSSIGIIQEIRAKRTLDKLAILNEHQPLVIRDGTEQRVPAAEVVMDELLIVAAGDQVPVDGFVVDSLGLEVDESMLTGESDPVVKAKNDMLMSGSIVLTGSARFQATKVGADSYAAKLTAEASAFTMVNSELRQGIDQILKYVSYALLPVGALIIYNQLVSNRSDLSQALRGMVAALVPMVPEGLVLMTSVAMMVGIIRLGRFNCLVNEMPAIEGLARVDTVCADKTGTLTENAMEYHSHTVVDPEHEHLALTALPEFLGHDPHGNSSIDALSAHFTPSQTWELKAAQPFNSANKWSGFTFEQHGSWILGAPDMLLPAGSPISSLAESMGAEGLRVLVFGSATRSVTSDHVVSTFKPFLLLALAQKVRADAKNTLEYFERQNVDVKVISGDNALSVGAVAQSLGLGKADEALDARSLPSPGQAFDQMINQKTVFGRVKPEQKQAMVHSLQASGHTVAMTGDGVNDILALKSADIGVAMGSGSAAARSVAQIVLLDNKFATLPHVVAEGRRVIGNIERVSNLFLSKTIYSIVLALLIGLSQLPFPLLPRHITIVAWFTIGIPAFVLSLAPNHDRAEPGFVPRVLRTAIPGGLIIGGTTFASYAWNYTNHHSTSTVEQLSTSVLITLMIGAFWLLGLVARPLNLWKVALITVMVASAASAFLLPLMQNIFMLDTSNNSIMITSYCCGLLAIVLLEFTTRLLGIIKTTK